ncbi:MAG: SusC/RagA family TonB-linked outer membrane protein [Parafilimonas sp.]
MKLTALILTIGCVHAFAAGFSQEKINLNLKNAPLKNAINSIQRNSNYRFIYNDDILPKDKKITANFYDADLNDVLNFVFQSTMLTYKILENNLIVISSQQPVIITAVTGNVQLKNSSGNMSPHAGVSVIEKGTTNGTTTNESGAFTLNVKDVNATLVISFIGYKSQEVALNGRTSVNIILEEESKELESVVVTALGITRQKRSLSYAAQSLNNNDVTAGREVNITDELNGKVAGLNINKTNAGPGSSNRIVFRGNRSITGNNQPLLIVDGVRLDNDSKALSDVTYFGTRDNGDGISNINPDDIESVTVLTGASAAALYGSDASNGAIVITTKKGKTGKGIGVQVSSSAMFENPMIYPKLQNVYGQGDGGQFVDNSVDSWGPKMTGQQVTDWTGKTQSLTPQSNNFKDFFKTGSELINAIALSTGNEKSQTYFSYTNTLSKGIMPNNTFKRNNFNLRQTVQLTSKLSVDMKANYIVEDVQNRPFTGGGNHALVTLYSMPRSLRLSDIANYETLNDDGTLTQNYWAPPSPDNQNPYWSVYRNLYEKKRNRFIGLISLKYQITPELSIQGRSSIDYYTDNAEEKDYSGTYWLTDYPGQGNYIVDKESNQLFNNDVLLSYNKNLNDNFHLNINAGASIEQFRYERTIVNTQGLNAPNIFSLSNGVSLSPNINNYYPEAPLQKTEKQSVYASAELGFKNYLFLDLTGRNDWNSTLPVNNDSYFFPSAGLSAILSDMLKLPDFISMLKARASYAYVGNGTGYNQLKPSHVLVPGGNGGFLNLDRTLHNAELKPEQTRSFETGLELGLFNNRFHAEATYYKTNTRNQILTIGVPNPSGYAFRIINAGNIQNSGVELLMNATPVQTKDFKWNVNLTFGHNKNKVIALDSLETMPPLSSPETLGEIVVRQGGSYGEIYTSSFVRNDNGQIIVNDNGLPTIETDVTKHFAGNFNPDWTAGITNTFTYKAFSLSVLIDERKGGIIVSGTQALEVGNGVSELTLANRETPFVVPNSVKQDGSKNDVQVTAQDYWMHVGNAGGNPVGELFTYSATNIRMREATLTYALPTKVLGNAFIKGASISLVGRNLFFLKNNAYGFDPEAALGTGNNQGLEYTSVPSTRNYGVYVKLNF